MSSLRISGAKTPLTSKASWSVTGQLSLKSEFGPKEVVWIITVVHKGHFWIAEEMHKFYDNFKKIIFGERCIWVWNWNFSRSCILTSRSVGLTCDVTMCSPVENTSVSVEPPKYIQGLYLGMLSSAEIIQHWRPIYKWIWSLRGMTLSKENRGTGERRVPLSICQSQIPHRLSQISCSKDETRGGGLGRNVGINLPNYTKSCYRRYYCTKETGKTRQNRIRQEINV